MKFVGREEQLEKLGALWRKRGASFAVVSGRRRIGKSTLVEEFARRSGCRFIELVGLPPDEKMTNQRQLDHFCERLAVSTGMPEAKVDGWAKAFDALNAYVSGHEKTIVFLDEISWMGRYDSAFAGFLKNAWDTQLSQKPKLILVVAGSVSAWIRANIQKAKGFVGRISLDLTLQELSLRECREFWGRKAERVSPREMLDVLSVTGGVPKYLSEMDPSHSADDTIRRLCFDADGYLFQDFNRIFDDVFESTVSVKKRIVLRLAEGACSATGLAEALGVEANGHLSQDLQELVEAGYVAVGEGKNPQTGKDVREVRYRLKDNYTRFYLKTIEPRRVAIQAGVFRYGTLSQLPGWESIMGLQFENLVLNHFQSLARIVGLVGKNVESVAPYYRKKSARCEGVQIDLLIQLPKCVYVVEIKRKNRISVAIEDEVQQKMDRLGLPRGKSVKTVLVYDGELDPAVEENGFFDYLVSAEQLFDVK